MKTNYEIIGHVIGERLAPIQSEIDELKKEVLALKKLNNLLKPEVIGLSDKLRIPKTFCICKNPLQAHPQCQYCNQDNFLI